MSLSVCINRIQVRLNNDKDEVRHRLSVLSTDPGAMERAVGARLEMESTDGIKRIAIRATLDAGYASPNWD